MQPPKRKTPIKTTHQFLIRAKMYGVICLNSLEGMMKELDELIPIDMEKDNIDTFSEELRRYQNRSIMPTSHGDFMDRAIRSLAKEIGLQIPIELGNSAVVKNFVSNIILCSHGDERRQYLEWLEQPNELITKSVRFEHLSPQSVSDDTLNFIRRSINELIRSKATKDHLRSQLANNHAMLPQSIENMITTYDGYHDGSVYITNHMDENERIVTPDMMAGMRQPTERELELENQLPPHARPGGNVAL